MDASQTWRANRSWTPPPPHKKGLLWYKILEKEEEKTHIINFSADRPNCAKFPSLKCAHIYFWLNPTGHSKFHNTSNHPPPATDSGWSARTPLFPPVQAVPHYSLPPPFFSCPGQRNRRKPVPVPVTSVRYNSLLWMCTLNTLTWPHIIV